MNKLVILESPNKIKKVSNFLNALNDGNKYIVKASVGHVRQLANGGVWNTGINENMQPSFIIAPDKVEVVKQLKTAAGEVDEIILATDPDREGEVIAWHLWQILKEVFTGKFSRLKLHAISQEEVKKQINNLGEINQNYVNAGLERAMLDKLVGYGLSPILQQSIGGASAGRVQSAVLLLLNNREQEIMQHKTVEFYCLEDDNLIRLKNVIKDDKGNWVKHKILDKVKAERIKNNLNKVYEVVDVQTKEFKDSPFINFTTSDYLQAAKSKLKLSVKKATQIAQSLFEKGLITYIRTDSTILDKDYELELLSYANNKFGIDNVVDKVPARKGKETDQEGHPPITPVHINWHPENIANYIKGDDTLTNEEINVYKLIWQNTINSALKVPSGQKTTYILKNSDHIFIGENKQYQNLGYINFDVTLSKPENIKLTWNKNDIVNVIDMQLIKDSDKPKSRFNEATLIKELEKKGLGRPSTYKTMVEVNQQRNYVETDKKDAMFVTQLGQNVAKFVNDNWNRIINLEFTKNMEADLDKIAEGKLDHINYLKDFYNHLNNLLNKELQGVKKCAKCNIGNLVTKTSKKCAQFIGCSNYPDCDYVEFGASENEPICEVCKTGNLRVGKTKVGNDYQYCTNKECKFVNWDYGVKLLKCPKCKELKVKKLVAKNGTVYKKCFMESCDYIEFNNKK